MTEINTHNLMVDFGRHKGEPWTRVPISYLRWLVNETEGDKKAIAEAELKRRNFTMPTDLELSEHAINRASQITKEWQANGVCSWLRVIANEALTAANGAEEIKYKGFKFAFAYGEHFPTLKTIMKKDE